MPGWTQRTAVIAVVTALVTTAVTYLMMPLLIHWLPADGPEQPPAQGPGSLPAVVGAPAMRTPAQEQAPIGAASVLYTGNTWFDDADLSIGLVGRGDDTYRVAASASKAGMTGVLSPDGTRVATEEGILDLATGVTAGYPPVWAETWPMPQAWSSDGTRIAVLVGGYETGRYGVTDMRMSLLEPATGTVRELARLGEQDALPGWAAAFSPDGSRLAFKTAEGVRVLTLAGNTTVDVPLPPGTQLAGKGAWSRDGASLLVVSGADCDCGDYPMRWTVSAITAANGRPTGQSWSRDGVYALRVLGWWPSGSPVAVEYTAVDDTEPTTFDEAEPRDDLTSQITIETARLIELDTGRALLSGDTAMSGGAVESLDVADQILTSGAVRRGDPPWFDNLTLLLVPATVVAVAVLVVLLLLVWWLVARSRAGRGTIGDEVH